MFDQAQGDSRSCTPDHFALIGQKTDRLSIILKLAGNREVRGELAPVKFVMRCIGEPINRNGKYAADLMRIEDERIRPGNRAHDRCDDIVGNGENFFHPAQNPHIGWLQTDFLAGFAKSGRHGRRIPGVTPAAGKGDLSFVVPDQVCTPGVEDMPTG